MSFRLRRNVYVHAIAHIQHNRQLALRAQLKLAGQIHHKVALAIALSRPQQSQKLAIGYRYNRDRKRSCLKTGTNYWRRERDSNPIKTPSQISKLRI